MGNICRSPTVEAVARVEFARAGLAIEVASAGTEGYHVGDAADPRSIAVAEGYGYPLAGHRARQVVRADFERYDYVLAMDRVNLRALERARPDSGGAEPRLFLGDDEVPDPYYGNHADFEKVVALARAGVDTWIERLRKA
ncbi:MAG: low molecular weight phosphotyrosine protein phosphatase [Dokdonella sp.]|nr:low molecular weight phosphotyrosine protein phosphatase [Dokdonella sp.]